jgi:hypothetical protein
MFSNSNNNSNSNSDSISNSIRDRIVQDNFLVKDIEKYRERKRIKIQKYYNYKLPITNNPLDYSKVIDKIELDDFIN